MARLIGDILFMKKKSLKIPGLRGLVIKPADLEGLVFDYSTEAQLK